MNDPQNRRRGARRLVGGLVVLVTIAVALSAASCAAPELGVVDGRLRPCPSSPNCVGSEDPDEGHRVSPIPLEGDMDSVWTLARDLVDEWPRTEVLEEGDDYVRFVVTSAVFRFRDDLELRLDREQRLIHVRSASRVGYSDFGVNRERVDRLREDLRGLAED